MNNIYLFIFVILIALIKNIECTVPQPTLMTISQGVVIQQPPQECQAHFYLQFNEIMLQFTNYSIVNSNSTVIYQILYTTNQHQLILFSITFPVGSYNQPQLNITDSSNNPPTLITLPSFICKSPPSQLTLNYYTIADQDDNSKLLKVYFNENEIDFNRFPAISVSCYTISPLSCFYNGYGNSFKIRWGGATSNPLLPTSPYYALISYTWSSTTKYIINVTNIQPYFNSNVPLTAYNTTIYPGEVSSGAAMIIDPNRPIGAEILTSVSSLVPQPFVWSSWGYTRRVLMNDAISVYSISATVSGSLYNSMYIQNSYQMVSMIKPSFNVQPTHTISRTFLLASTSNMLVINTTVSFFQVTTTTSYPLTLSYRYSNSYTTPPFPFGFTKKSGANVHQVAFINSASTNLQVYYQYLPAGMTAITGPSTMTASGPVPPGLSPPYIDMVEFQPFNSTFYLVRLRGISNANGILYITFGTTTIVKQSNLVSGDRFNGTYSFLVSYSSTVPNPNFVSPLVSVYDINAGSTSYSFGSYLNADFSSVPLQPPPCPAYQLKIDNFVSIQWYPSIVDTGSSTPATTSIVFTLDSTIVSPISLDIVLPLDSTQTYSLTSQSYYDSNLKAYRADFTIPQNMDNYTINYKIGNFLYSCDILPKLGIKSQLSTISKNGDKIGPRITNVLPYPTSNVIISGLAVIGFDVYIEDDYNGFKYGVINVTSDMDRVPRTFKFTTSDFISGNSSKGIYKIRWSLDDTYPSQMFTIDRVLLVDNSGWSSYSPLGIMADPLYPTPTWSYTTHSASIVYLNATTFLTLNLNELPIVHYFNASRTVVDVTSNNRNVTFKLGVSSVSGLSARVEHQPIVYMLDCDLSTYSVLPVSYSQQADNITEYLYQADIPYGFGSGQGIALSIHGITNVYYNYLSLSTADLQSTGGSSFIGSLINQKLPYLINSSPLKRDNQPITVYGQSLPITPTTLQVTATMNSQSSNFNIIQSTELYLIVNITNIPMTTKSITLSIGQSNAIVIPVVDYVNTVATPSGVQPILVCPGNPQQCSGNGLCTSSGCQCTGQWFGPDCSSTAINVDKPNVTTTDPTVKIGGGDIPPSIYSIISIYSIRELDINSNIINEFKFNNWIFNNLSSVGGVQYEYSSLLSSNRTTRLNVTIQWFQQSTNLTFGGDQIILPPSSTKITLQLSPYVFDSTLNTLQILMNVSLVDHNKDDSCSSTSYGLTENNSLNDIQWVKIRVGDTSVYARFIRKGIIDTRLTTISNSIITLNESSTTRSFVGVNVPNYFSSVVLDPDISMLLDQNIGGCGNNSKGLTVAQLAGIIVASVGVAVIISLLIALKLKNHYRIARSGVSIKLVRRL